ncbi:MAG: O-acetylhomoserine aminocarboxypropyltransferase/cysteine synthase [Clostridium sp.]|jgi:O-acetylhomoserine (thiol)-lyase|uniref:O-acetylhomoserine aminocarboxypropyltransferase/cysteine synthase family protein n=1 Tax=Clostridium sp. TaxID=1506 RepID=UPI0025C44A38|nr:O-acetylhomoserine aminocarboxypropyltransferase/cysteine synthase family protein [Clostridium sp.]MCH3963702.1 O-acetylhomoserine aminocarboxypropyltransferase/cysteine synthase [Clostridium sp.]MCI1714843.1 O-acetylhomoserine aminocarboxypropyltransferase/cysteine synthase [Clostridium sp.]MCI1798968.1 O-acetylhomoserine aminocarboxypropyltransferase/cysteine synthase [Clostridium sp.]MCI1813026.1 O-acetylhomoserine aminocarboxypropyltransferase/cysteine synthase [Clostridium sp.]MCI18699
MSEEKDYEFETLQLRAGYKPEEHNYACTVPIYQTASFNIGDTDRLQRLKSREENGFFYTRSGNPTLNILEKRITALEGGTAAIAVSSGMAAVAYSLLNAAEGGGEIIAVYSIYAGSYNLLEHTLPKFGVKVKWIENPYDTESFKNAITENTKCIFIESIGNPLINVIDIETIANIAHEENIPLIVDNTFATSYLLKPFEFGADIVVYSSTKSLAGHGSTLGGLIVENNKFDWSSGKFPHFTEPDYKVENKNLLEVFPDAPFTARVRLHYLSELGAVLSPFNAFLILQGIETLSVRIEREVENTEKIIDHLLNHPQVSWVSYPNIKDERNYRNRELSEKYLPKGAGSIFSFGFKGSQEDINKFLNSLKVFSFLVNVGDSKSLVIQPSRTTHSSLSEERREKAGAFENALRVSVGLENVNDLISDLDQAFEKSLQ